MSAASTQISQWVPGYGPAIEISERDLDTLLSAPFERYVQLYPETGEPVTGSEAVYAAENNASLICLQNMTVAEFHDQEEHRFQTPQPVEGTHDADHIQWRTVIRVRDEDRAYADVPSLTLTDQEQSTIKDALKQDPTWIVPNDGSSRDSEWDSSLRQASLGSITRAGKESPLCIMLNSSRGPEVATRRG